MPIILGATVICAPLNLTLQEPSFLPTAQPVAGNSVTWELAFEPCSFLSTHVFLRISLGNVFHVTPVHVQCDHDTKTNTAGIYIHFTSPLNWKAYLSFFLCLTSSTYSLWAKRVILAPDHTRWHTFGLPWTWDRPVAQASTWQHTTLTKKKHERHRRHFFLLYLKLHCHYITIVGSLIGSCSQCYC